MSGDLLVYSALELLFLRAKKLKASLLAQEPRERLEFLQELFLLLLIRHGNCGYFLPQLEFRPEIRVVSNKSTLLVLIILCYILGRAERL